MNSSSPAIQIDHLKFSWVKNTPLTLDVDHFSVQPGEHVFLKGESGSGKSTLLNLLGGVLVPNSGKITLLDQSLTNLNSTQRDVFRSNHIGFIFQMFNLLPYLSVLENVTLPLSFSNDRKNRTLKKQNINDEAMRLLAHLNLDDPSLLSRSVSELSVGQQQRVAAARALMGTPEIIIADEPTSSLDSDHRDNFINLLTSECRQNQSTLLFVSHDQSLERHFDRTLSLSDINNAQTNKSAVGLN
ncbi:MAG: ABC transporter ATP-binding protein [Gammaproteobacteria bacterium]|nr:ABC transporter ATP-binding protein [Gammaproteobacteria bacterium]